ncbi:MULTISPECIES: class I lanthipeptide [Chryseobacterium]|uniref:Bacteriocin n=1 Tax=Chryseobacterium rhizosphaerae TaxID=395937 RepID=A0ABX9IKY8_9FLAO|nr:MULTISPECIES: class I lanthipeptide [Chryseobacterium]MBL3546356.1 class I lanthipeptide [Chryseobacterium sp. KMC2]REC75726.1 hypothetical protein DRF57_10175 [Chryseobacterium rhizosphaerae]GEN65469.1 hypothetical protein CRH01_00370 [Chryseobacterium rhizosphaerae]
MKKSDKKLTISKKNVQNLSKNSLFEVKGGKAIGIDDDLGLFTAGCSDGCMSKFMHTHLMNCSKANCTADCGNC